MTLGITLCPVRLSVFAFALAVGMTASPGLARDRVQFPLDAAEHGVVNVADELLAPGFWIARLQSPGQLLVTAEAIARRNQRLHQLDSSMHELAAMPARLEQDRVLGWIEGLAPRPAKALWDEDGKAVPDTALDAIAANRALQGIPATQATRYGMVVQRAALRTFPTALRVFSSQGETDIDRFQESALFPGDPVAIVHASADGQWLFVISPRYAAWVEARAIAEGDKASVLGHATRTPFRVVTGPMPRTVFTREEPRVSELQLDMGVRMPLATVPAGMPVNGQHPYTSWVLDLPVREDNGQLAFAPALLQRNADSASDYLPLTRANLIRQSFKFLGERYGWGHAYNGRDCSGFVSEVYASMGVLMPRNTSDQAVSPVFARTRFAAGDPRAKRLAAVAALDVGDLIYIPGHVLMFVGRIGGTPYVIHDINGGSVLGADGELRSLKLNGVSLTPLMPLRMSKQHDYVDRITNIVRVAKLQ